LFDDDMNVVLPTGTSFYNIDSVYDYILSLGMEPLVELSFSPAALATTNKTLFHYIAHISPPEPTAWYALIKEFGQHIQQRYSKATVEQWYFEVWNEPNCGFLDAPPDKIYQAYYDLYNNTASALKAANPKLQVGGPVTCQSDWVDPFLTWSKQNNVPVDFISTHLYPTDPNVVNGNTAPVILQTIATVRKHSATLPVFYSEYNDGLFNDPPLHDDPFAAAAILKTLSDLDGKLPLLSWWTFSDVFEEQGMPSQEFDKPNFTGWGMDIFLFRFLLL
jgi:xylan 1,4-beta-xylosidase